MNTFDPALKYEGLKYKLSNSLKYVHQNGVEGPLNVIKAFEYN